MPGVPLCLDSSPVPTRPRPSVKEISPSLASFIARLPKVELHLHLEGSLRPDTLRELSRRKGVLKKGIELWVRRRARKSYRYADFHDFLVDFGLVTKLLETPADYALATTRLMEWLREQNVRYAEVIFAAGVVLWKKQSVEETFAAVADAAQEARERLGVRVNWIFDAVRHFGIEHVREVLKWAARFKSRGVVAFGIGGDEARGPAELFPEVFREARDLGLHCTAHAGEAVGPESVRHAVEMLGAERIGHGLTAARDPSVMALLRERGIPLEVCLSSNVSTGVLARLEDHPLPLFLASGVTVTLNSDDPAMFGTSLEREMTLAAQTFGQTQEQLRGLMENAARAAFLPEGDKAVLLRELRAGAPATAG
jgi:aminodeoxyfutalosine deaminase